MNSFIYADINSSPKKAIELLNENPEDIFFNAQSFSINSRMYDRSELNSICATLLSKSNSEGLMENTLKPIQNYEPISPKEGYKEYRLPFAGEQNAELYRKCFEIKNKDVVALFKGDEGFIYSLKFSQEKSEQAKKIINTFYKANRPDCKVSFLEIPTLFSVNTSKYYSEDKSFNIKLTQSQAILPNTINNLKIGNNVFIPNTGNTAINAYMNVLYKNSNLNPVFLDSFDLHITGGNIHCSTQTIHTCKPSKTNKRDPSSEVSCEWKDREQLKLTARSVVEKFKTRKFNSLFNLVGYKFESDIQKQATVEYYIDTGRNLKEKSFNYKNDNAWIVDSFSRIMSNPDAKPLLNNVFIDLDTNYKTVASAKPGAPASIDINPNTLKIYFENVSANLKETAISFILSHELGHLIVESVRTEEIGSFDKANSDEFYGKLKHHLLIDAVGMYLIGIDSEQVVNILRSFPNDGDFSKRVYCWERL